MRRLACNRAQNAMLLRAFRLSEETLVTWRKEPCLLYCVEHSNSIVE